MLVARNRGQRGETLVESLMALLILLLVGIACFAGLQTTMGSTHRHRDSSVAETMLRSAAEQLQRPDSTYIALVGCAGHGDYTLPTASGYDDIRVEAAFWDGAPPALGSPMLFTPAPNATPPARPDCSGIDDHGLQRLRLSVTTPSGVVERLDVIKRRG
jgi:type II secretory pathway pseudopilin PulG